VCRSISKGFACVRQNARCLSSVYAAANRAPAVLRKRMNLCESFSPRGSAGRGRLQGTKGSILLAENEREGDGEK
jgi:hypothetical protein